MKRPEPPRSTEHIVTLTRPPAALEAQQRREYRLGLLPAPGSEFMGIPIRDENMEPCLVSRAVVERLRREGWRGLSQIPEECIVDP